MRYIGIDLAWGQKNTTAVVVLVGPDDAARGAWPLAFADALLSDDEIVGFVAAYAPANEGVIVAIDAPTIVPNETGRRPCEAILSRCMARAQAGPHPANRRLVGGPDGTVRGETLVARLAAECAIPQTPYLNALTPPVRAAFEAFPHPAHIALFALEKTLKYKTKPNRSLAGRLDEFRRYAVLLDGLAAADPPLLASDGASKTDAAPPLWRRDPDGLNAALLKRHEDALDALTCAYIALYRYRWGDRRSVVLGDLTRGYIVTPATPAMRACFEAAASAMADAEKAMESGTSAL